MRWHRQGFRRFWRWKSTRKKPGRPAVSKEIRDLIRKMARENVTWGALRIHGELLKLGFNVSERTVSRQLPRRPASPDSLRRWMAFLHNHADGIAAMDFFTVPTATFRVLYVFVVIQHGSRRILHTNVTANPNAAWVSQQLREAFPFDTAPTYLIRDNDKIFGEEVKRTIAALGIESKPTAPHSPWQNGVCERWNRLCRQEMLNHVIPLGEAHLRRLVSTYVALFSQGPNAPIAGQGHARKA